MKYFKTSEGYFFLKELKIYSQKDLFEKESLDFSYFKFGVKKYFNIYIKLLIKMIKIELGPNINSDKWVIVSRANFIHNNIFGSISDALAKSVAKKLNLKYVISCPNIDIINRTNYSKLKSSALRLKEINKRNYLLYSPDNINLRNKNIIFIDDIINSGLTIKTIRDYLGKYNIRSFKVFTIAKLFSSSLSYEYKLTNAILLKDKQKNIKYLKRLFFNSKLIVTNKFLKLLKRE